MPILDLLVAFAAAVRADRAANPRVAGEGTGLEFLLAPRFRALVEALLPELGVLPPAVLPEYTLGGVGRPDLAFARPGQPARAFIELKVPANALDPRGLRGHDADQFRRFGELPLWGYCNFTAIHLYRRGDKLDQAEIVPATALDPATQAARAEALIRSGGDGGAGFARILQTLASAGPPAPRDAQGIAATLAHAARPEAGGYDQAGGDALFASAFAQTLVFGFLFAREAAHGAEVGADAYRLLPESAYPLLRGTLRALTLDEVRKMLGAAFDVALDAANSVVPDLLAPRDGRDPMLYLYEDFLRVFDPEAVAKYGVYYTPPEVVRLIVAQTDGALRDGLGTDGLLDPNVRLLDPACGTGTFLIAAAGAVAEAATARYGAGMAGPEVSGLAGRMGGFELLVGPYTVAHYRMLREVAGHGGSAGHLPIYLTDTLAPPSDAAGVETHLAFMGAPMVEERGRRTG